MEFLIIAFLVSRYLVQNYWQDGLHAWRGEDPPSYRREQERLKAKQAKGEGPDIHRAAKQFFRNGWNDAFETAEENRARRRAKRLKDRHEKWAAEDENQRAGEVDEILPIHEFDRLDGLCWYCEKEPATASSFDNSGEPRPACAACAEARAQRPHQNRNTPDPEPFPEAPAPNDTCWYCGSPATTTCPNNNGDLRPACAGCKDREGRWPSEPAEVGDPARTASDDDQPYEVVDPAPADPPPGGKVIQFPTMNTTTKEEPMSEIAGLRAAIAYTKDSADKATEAAQGIELAISGLTAGGTSGLAIAELQGAREALNLAAARFMSSHDELVRHLAVAEQYEANQGAGEKAFVTNN